MKRPLISIVISHKILLIISLFISYGNLHAQDLFQAIRSGNYKKVEQIILQNPGWVDSTNMYGSQPLYLSSFYRNEKIAELLIKNGADMYYVHPDDGRTALHTAVLWSRTPIAKVLIKNGMDVNVKDTENKTPLIRAIEKKNKELVEFLLAHNAQLPEDRGDMNLFLHFAVQFDFPDIADTLIKKGASLISVDNNGRSLLHNAVIGTNLKWIDLLIEKDLNVNKQDSFLRTPLHYSVDLNQPDITETLINKGAEINSIDNTNRTPLTIAHDLGYKEIALLLESKEAKLSEPKSIEIENEGNRQSDIKVTYIANMGVVISSASKTVLIDALFNKSYNTYPITPNKIVSKINKFEPPFHSIDLIMVTHSDGDHFSAPMIAEYLAINKSVKVVCNTKTSSALKENIDSGIDSTRIVGITPDLFSSTDTLVNDIEVKVLRLRHSGSNDQNDNLGFLIEFDGIKVFHQGDAGSEVRQNMAIKRVQEYDSIGIEAMKIDVAILNRGSLWNSNSPGLEIIKNQMKPKHIILTHFSEYNKQGEWETVDKTIKENSEHLPGITEFKWPMQSIIIRKGH